MRIDAWFDPRCPWTWATSRWLVDAAAARGHQVRWHPYSLALKNDEGDDGEHADALPALRVAAAVSQSDPAAVGPLYTELGRRIHHDGERLDDDIAGALAAVGLEPELAAAADDPSLDRVVEASMAEAIAMVGEDVGLPIVAFTVEGRRVGASGPILCDVPGEEEGLRLLDAVVAAVGVPGFAELKRTRTRRAPLPERP
jgi:2-hydroxychromene-2-carboxylate isomerase